MDFFGFIVFCLLLAGIGAFFMSCFAFSWGLVDLPNERSSHIAPTPRGGGIGILLTVPIAGVWLGLPLAIWGTAFAIGLLSFFDDRLGLAPRARFVLQVTCAAIFLGFTVVWPTLSLPLWLLAYGFGLVYLTGTANFFNFMDGINGIAGIVGGLAFATLSVYGRLHGMPDGEIVFNMALAAACLGFLPFNFPKAKVFMGDVGSVTLGFLFAAQAFRYAGGVINLLLLSGFLFMFYADTLTTLFIRWRAGERLSQAHRRHLYQICVNQLGMAHWRVSCVYGLAQILISFTLFYVMNAKSWIVLLVLVGWFLVFCFVTFHIRKRLYSLSG